MTNIVLPYNPIGSDTKSIEGVMNNFAAVLAVVNGGLTDSNIAVGAGIALSKLASFSYGVSSFNSRTGAIAPATNDYSVSQINGLAYSDASPGYIKVGPLKIVWGAIPGAGTFLVNGNAQSFSLTAAQMGLSSVWGGVVNAWPEVTWNGFIQISNGHPASNSLSGEVLNSVTAQAFDVYYFAVGDS